MNKIIKLLYVDDEIDNLLSDYLDENISNQNCPILDFKYDYYELEFSSDINYQDLLNDEKIRTANIIIIDSRLFNNDNSNHKYRGEEIELLIRKTFPFIEVIVITQNNFADGRNIVRKYASTSENDRNKAFNHYQEKLRPIIEDKCKSVISRRFVAIDFEKNDTWDELTKERLVNSFRAVALYEELTKEDIDRLILSFKQIENKINRES